MQNFRINFFTYSFKWIYVVLLILLASLKSFLNAQSISPYTINNGGGINFNIEWSIGESVSIAQFTTAEFKINTGVLQPMTSIVTSINDFGLMDLGNDFFIGPNPTNNFLQLKANFTQMGKLTIQLINTNSLILQTFKTDFLIKSYSQILHLEKYPAGIFYIRYFFEPINGNTKSGLYKIIKI